MLDLSDLASEAESLAAQLRGARCCDALLPCYRCSLLKFNVLARRRVIEIPKSAVRPKSRTGVLSLVPLDPGLELRAS
jgi:hypothetical protein